MEFKYIIKDTNLDPEWGTLGSSNPEHIKKNIAIKRRKTVMKEAILSSNAPRPIGPYSQGVVSGEHIYISGQLPLSAETNRLAEGIEHQTRQSLDNIKSILEEKELGMDAVVKTTIFMTDLVDFQTVNSIYAEYFTEPFPARSTVQVAKLPMDALIEIELVAETKKNN